MSAKSNAMNATMGRTTMASERLSSLERILLVVPMLGGLFFGIMPLFFPAQFAQLTGFSGNDPYLSRLAGAVTLGYVPGLLIAILQGQWTPVRLVVLATLVFNIGSLFAIAMAILSGGAQPVVYLILVASVLITGITAWMLNAHRDVPKPAADIAPWVFYLIIFLTAAAFGTGTLFTFIPGISAQLFGFQGTDEFVFRQGGAATLGFAVMGVFQLRSKAWQELRLPSLNALLFNGASLIATIYAIFSGDPILLLLVVLLVTLVATVGCIVTLVRQGK